MFLLDENSLPGIRPTKPTSSIRPADNENENPNDEDTGLCSQECDEYAGKLNDPGSPFQEIISPDSIQKQNKQFYKLLESCNLRNLKDAIEKDKELKELLEWLHSLLAGQLEDQEIQRVFLALDFAVTHPQVGIATLKNLLSSLKTPAALSLAGEGLKEATSYAIQWAKLIASRDPEEAMDLLRAISSTSVSSHISAGHEPVDTNEFLPFDIHPQAGIEEHNIAPSDLDGAKYENVNGEVHLHKDGEHIGHVHSENVHGDKEGIKDKQGNLVYLHRDDSCSNCSSGDPEKKNPAGDSDLERIYTLDENGYIAGMSANFEQYVAHEAAHAATYRAQEANREAILAMQYVKEKQYEKDQLALEKITALDESKKLHDQILNSTDRKEIKELTDQEKQLKRFLGLA